MSKNENFVTVFVYGTLKRGGRAQEFMEGAEYIGEGVLSSYVMFPAGGAYPGIIKTEDRDAKVYGEIWSVPRELIPSLDLYEGEGYLYLRKTEIISMPGLPGSIEAQVYVYNRDTGNAHIIPEGIWPVGS